MKRICFGLLLLCVVGFLACDNRTNNNNNATPNANANLSPSPAVSTGASPTIATSPTPAPVAITITISDKDDHPTITDISPDPADLSGGKIADWTVVNNSTVREGQNAAIDIGSFKGNASSGNTPFGPRPGQNDFFVDLLQEGTTRHAISNPSKDNGRDEKYKYTVTLYREDGTTIMQVDPQIIVGIRMMDQKPGTTPTSGTKTASPSPTKSTTKP